MIFWRRTMNRLLKYFNFLLIALHSFQPWCFFFYFYFFFWGKPTKLRIINSFNKNKMNLFPRVVIKFNIFHSFSSRAVCVALVWHRCHLCCTCVALVLQLYYTYVACVTLVLHWCCTRDARVSLVLHLCCSYHTFVARVALVLPISGTCVVK